MNDKPRSESFYAKVQKYGGWAQTPTERIYAVFEDIVDPSRIGFSIAKRGYLARRIDDDIAHVLKLSAFKGRAYGLSYGVSLSYVPYPYAPEVKWHRTMKSVSLDLFEQPQEHMTRSEDWPGGFEFTATSMLGETCFREELDSIWRRISTNVLAWLDATRSLGQVLSRCDEHLAWNWRGPRHSPEARLVRAFTQARMGRLGEARTDLERFLTETEGGEEARANLSGALEKVSGQDSRRSV